ncbi:hypothetical protein DFH28DRAFT_993976 [Melampsora americana]|nr:hypothetical protein DFH28DRAFT_993976 [Melampsora americana]
MAYSDLLNIIHFIQTILDDQADGPQERLVPSSILNILDAENSMLDVEVRNTWGNDEFEIWGSATKIRSQYGVELPLSHYLPERRSPEWFSLYVFVCHTSDFSHVSHTNIDLPEEEQNLCPICASGFQFGECYIPLSCHACHWLHKSCFTELEVHSLELLCQLCRERPYPE